ncbi:MAG: pseudouridine synthase [Christensenellales bacterium]
MRINKYLAECGVCSRRKADELVKEGRVSVNKKIVREVGTDVNENQDVVYVDGKKVVRVTHYDYLLFYKPKGCVTTLNEERDNKSGRKKTDKELEEIANRAEKLAAQGITEEKTEYSKPRKIITDFIGADYRDKRLYPVGRLDYDSEGLLLLTNDGNLTYKLTHPSSEIPKTYVVKIEGTIEESDLAALRKGVTVDGVKYGRSKVKVTGIEKVGGSKKATIDPKDVRAREAIECSDDMQNVYTRLEVIIFEGKNREIRKMFEAVEKKVVFLKRVAIGDLRLGGLARGAYRPLNDMEIAYLQSLCEKA